MNEGKKPSLALFLTAGMSLTKWQKIGILKREMAMYHALENHFKTIYIVSYGNESATDFAGVIPKNAIVLPKKMPLPKMIHQLLIPLFYRKDLKSCTYLKTNQVAGLIPAALCKLFFKKPKLIIRSGYSASLFAKLQKLSRLRQIIVLLTERFGYTICDEAVITSEAAKQYLIKRHPVLKKKLRMIPNLIDCDAFRPNQQQKKYDIGFVGRLHPDKNIMCLLEAVKDTKLRIALVGNGKQKEDLLQNASKNKVPLTQIDGMSNGDLPDFLNSCRLFVLPSHFEGCPKALLEAMACGLPVIGNDMIGINDVICHNTNGLLFNGSAVDLKNQIDLLLADTTLQKRLAKAARKYVLQNHSLETILSLETKLYETTA